MEAKLFINTMIAAYRTTYEPPMVEILNEEAELLKEESGNGSDPNLVYKMNWMKEYGNNLDGTKEKNSLQPGRTEYRQNEADLFDPIQRWNLRR